MNVKKIGIYAVIGLVVFLIAVHFNLVPGARRQAAEVPKAFELANEVPDVDTPVTAGNVALELPSTKPAAQHAPVFRMNIWAWNAQMGLILANGGPTTTQGSAMDKHGVSLKITRQDDTNVSQAGQVQFANALTQTSTPSDGVEYVTIMGDGAAAYLQAINTTLKPLGPDYRAEIVGAVGYSRGEDGWWGPQEWKDSVEAMKGGATAGVLRDGDWNIAQYKLANDGIKNNPDEKTWDPDAMNWFAADDYLKAVELYISGYCEDRQVVRNGKITSEPKHHTCVQGVVTWTPGDVNLAKSKGGLVRLLSTKENVYQMPSVIIGIHKWNVGHAKQVQGMLAAAFDGADMIKRYPEALSRAGQASYAIYAEQSAAYWVRYYKGTVERDKTGNPVPLGGSTVMNLGDNLVLFGIAEGTGGISNSVFKATYEGFGTIASQQYPKLLPTFPRTEEAVNLTFLQALATAAAPETADNATLETFDTTTEPIDKESVVAQKNWQIQFDTGKATFTPAAQTTLEQLYNQLVIGGALQIEIDGHTDNVGNPGANLALSQARAQAVSSYLRQRAGKLFPEGRVNTRGYGDAQPIAPNTTELGRAQNRRVTVVLGTKI